MRILSLATALIALSLASTTSLAAPAKMSGLLRFGGVKQWKLFYSYTMSSPFGWTEHGETTSRYAWTGTESGVALLKTENAGEEALTATGTGSGTGTLNFGYTRTS